MSLGRILVIGAGELGSQVVEALVRHPRRGSSTGVSVLLRPGSITSPQPEKAKLLEYLRGLDVLPVPGDIVRDSESDLSQIFHEYDTVVGCTGFVAGSGTQTRITRAVLAAGVRRYIPWQFGVDYDAIGRGSGNDVFDEQLDVRDLLRSQTGTTWAILSTGMFTSFLFDRSFGVVDMDASTVRALGSWENSVTVTTPEDIGKLTAEVVLGNESGTKLFANKPIFVGGDTISYQRLAQLLEKLTGRPFQRDLLTVEDARASLAKDPDNAVHKYEIVFGKGHGVAWDISETWNYQAGIQLSTAEEWAKRNLV